VGGVVGEKADRAVRISSMKKKTQTRKQREKNRGKGEFSVLIHWGKKRKGEADQKERKSESRTSQRWKSIRA